MRLDAFFKQLIVGKSDHGFIQLIRYGLVVAIAAPIDLGGYILLKSHFHIHYVLAATLSFTASLIVNYFLSVAWVWTGHSGRQRHLEITMFTVIGIIGLGLTDLIVFLGTDFGKLNYIISKLIAFVCVFFWSFGARRLLFNRRVRSDGPAPTYR